jgi:hypothetical protein
MVNLFRGRSIERLALVLEAVLHEIQLAVRMSFKVGFTELRIFS